MNQNMDLSMGRSRGESSLLVKSDGRICGQFGEEKDRNREREGERDRDRETDRLTVRQTDRESVTEK